MRDKVIISQLSKTKTIVGLIIGFCLVGVIYWAILTPTPTMTLLQYFASRSSAWTLMGLLGLVANTVTLVFIFATLFQLVMRKGAAVWIEGDQLIYMNPLFLAVRLADIKVSTVGIYGKYRRTGIVLKLRDGREKVIPTRLLSEAPLIVLTRLNQCLAKNAFYPY